MSLIPEATFSGLSVLNCAAGDLKFSFDSDDPEEVKRAQGVVTDMLKRGYVILAEVGGKLRRVKKFDAKTNEYIIQEPPYQEPEAKPKGKRGGYQRRVPAKGTRAIGIAPTAGG